jgi:pimeloyl-ACP methyl ester carboxylesterase
MTISSSTGFLTVDGASLEYEHLGPDPQTTPTLVLLHEGLGCVGLWGEFPRRLQEATGLGVFAYSRAGYGRSSPVDLPRPLTYVHDEALGTLPKVLDAIGLRRGLFIGHSDGASMATIHAGAVEDDRVCGISLIAPHFVVEDVTVTSIAATKAAYDSGGLRNKLARWHADPDVAFRGWSEAWLDPAFRAWTIADFLTRVRVPVQIVQGEDDQYGTLRQIEIAREACAGPLDVALVPGAAHSPHREAADFTLDVIVDFASRVLRATGRGGG